MPYIYKTGVLIVVLCLASLSLGALAGKYAAKAAAGFAKNLLEEVCEIRFVCLVVSIVMPIRILSGRVHIRSTSHSNNINDIISQIS